jgi:hypothetical protein
MNKGIQKSMATYLDALNPMDDDALFASRKGRCLITVQCVNNMVKKWVGEINLKGNYGAHSLRKTRGYIQRTTYGVRFMIYTMQSV